MHAPGDPRKIWGNRISSYIHPFTVHIAVRPGIGHYGNVTGRHGEAGACARNVYQALSPLKGPGYEATSLDVMGVSCTCYDDFKVCFANCLFLLDIKIHFFMVGSVKMFSSYFLENLAYVCLSISRCSMTLAWQQRCSAPLEE